MAFKGNEKSRIALSPGERRAVLILAALLLIGFLAGQARRFFDRDTSTVQVEGLEQLVAEPSPADTADGTNASSSVARQGSEGVISTPKVVDGGAVVDSPKAADSAVPGKININRANQQELETLPGIGPVLAGRIIEWRRAHGSFKRLEDLKLVKGIGDKTVERLAPYLTVAP